MAGSVYLVVEELHHRRVLLYDSGGEPIDETKPEDCELDLMGWRPVLAFPGTDKGKDRAKAFAKYQNAEAARPGATPKEYHGSAESRYWGDYTTLYPSEIKVFVVRRVEKK